MDDMKSKKFNRAANYTLVEKDILLQIVERYIQIVESKKSDAAARVEKDLAWECIAQDFNNTSNSSGFQRTAKSLKSCYDNEKKRAMKVVREEGDVLDTGDREIHSSKITNIQEKLLRMIPIATDPLDTKVPIITSFNPGIGVVEVIAEEVEDIERLQMSPETRVQTKQIRAPPKWTSSVKQVHQNPLNHEIKLADAKLELVKLQISIAKNEETRKQSREKCERELVLKNQLRDCVRKDQEFEQRMTAFEKQNLLKLKILETELEIKKCILEQEKAKLDKL